MIIDGSFYKKVLSKINKIIEYFLLNPTKHISQQTLDYLKYLFFKQNIEEFSPRLQKSQEMSVWKICNEDLLIVQHPIERLCSPKSIYNTHLSDQSLRKCLSSNNKNTSKISLRKVHDGKKKEQNFKIKIKQPERQAQPIKQKKNIQNSNIFLLKSSQKDHINNHVIHQTKIKNFNQSVFEEYFIMPTTMQHSPRPFNQSNVRINYINPQNVIKYNKPPVNQPINHILSFSKVKKEVRPLKRMKTLPVILPSTEIARHETYPSQNNQQKLSKSMNYNEAVKLINLKSTQNLHQIECVKAQSLLDSEQMRDEVSFALSPIDEGLEFAKSFTINQLWKDFAGREDGSHKEVSTPNSIPNEEVQI